MSSKVFTKQELAALAMHEIMKREQTIYARRVDEQRRMSSLSESELYKLVQGMPLDTPDPTPAQPKEGVS